ncbi:hypothetical protein GCM10025867_27710 [Frondihabitans sucicola]|uniref:Band 7 domain-containing protein n=1 Tax=Frondihabitans sucicola TaxID=1268041 RepID=A0ABM8GPZ4_9MICO|nr:hypothetical protein GCM10025867_27710 [Frondihabitans sucicola]
MTDASTIGGIVLAIVLIIVVIFVLVILFRAIRIIPQATAGVVERLGKYHKTLSPASTSWSRSSTGSGRCSTCASKSSRFLRSP